jgi:hypothetical protein
MHLVCYLYEDYHEARSLEHKVSLESVLIGQDHFHLFLIFFSRTTDIAIYGNEIT